ncbi:unnamed protein product [Ectocarpus sp. 8 AP-2014]
MAGKRVYPARYFQILLKSDGERVSFPLSVCLRAVRPPPRPLPPTISLRNAR